MKRPNERAEVEKRRVTREGVPFTRERAGHKAGDASEGVPLLLLLRLPVLLQLLNE